MQRFRQHLASSRVGGKTSEGLNSRTLGLDVTILGCNQENRENHFAVGVEATQYINRSRPHSQSVVPGGSKDESDIAVDNYASESGTDLQLHAPIIIQGIYTDGGIICRISFSLISA